MIEAAPITFPPLVRSASVVSRVDPPVVITSSTTRTLSPGCKENPRRKVIVPPSRSVQMLNRLGVPAGSRIGAQSMPS